MFGKKKKEQGLFNTVDDSRVMVNDFVRRPIFESYRPLEYRVYDKLCEAVMKPKLDLHLELLFKGEVDDANGDMLDNLIFGSYRESIPDLNIQRENHKDVNRRLVARSISDRQDFIKLRESRQEELSKLESELAGR